MSRRDFAKAALAIGGTSALSACVAVEGGDGDTPFPRGPDDLSTLPARQHGWGKYIVKDAHGNTIQPQHQLLLLLNYAGPGTPTDADRETVEDALRSVERAYQHGTGGDVGASINKGLLTMLGYSPSYFERFDTPLPDSLDVRPPGSVLDAVGEDPGKADDFDAVLVVTSDFASVVLAAEAALFGGRDAVNGVPVEATLDGVFERADRRTGVVGKGLPAEHLDETEIPDRAPLSMGFKSGFRDNLATEDAVTIPEGPFADGTTVQLSRLRNDTPDWYDHDLETRIDLMFSPEHDVDEVHETGEPLGASSGVTPETVENIESDAATHGCLGHSQKTATARDDDFQPLILRRSEGVATDDVSADGVGFNFLSIQETIGDFVETRQAMNPEKYDVDVDDPHHGIVDYLETESRATFLLPPRRHRALPSPRPES